MTELSHLNAGKIQDAKITEPPLQRTVTGYGPKLPLPYMLKIANRWHRVYVAQYGNSGSAYVVLNKTDHYLSGGSQFILESMRDGSSFTKALETMRSWPDWLQHEEDLS